jgi:hypothetical protein
MFVKTTITEYIREVLFRVRWLAMSDRQRYAYLWNRTKETL